MEFGKEESSNLQYSDTREEEEEEEEGGEEEEVEQEEEEEELLFQDQFNKNKVINATTTYHRHHQQQLPLLSSSLGSPSSSSSVTKKWINSTSTPATTRDHDHHHHQHGQGVPEFHLSDMNRMSWAGEREHMFDKVVTPSDVGKLNRLVIPKQHAEKYFPLDPTSTDKGLLLNFEDRTGKSWRFRYSYWNSSQSYVMTKGWSRFVKEKKLDAGDIVSFHRSAGGGGGVSSLFIDWRRRPNHHYPNADHHHHHHLHRHPYYPQYHHQRWGYSLPQSPAVPPASHEIGAQSSLRREYMANINNNNNYYYYGHHVGVVRPPVLFESVPVPVAAAPAQPKRLRLFGVNMEYCPSQEDPNDYRYRHQISPSHHHHQVRLPNNNIPSPFFPLLPTTATTTAATSGSSFPEFSHKGKSSASSLSFDLDP